jgi:uncharacterized membrane protein YoaK (UPF0700 family)
VHNEDRSETNRDLLNSLLSMVALVVGGALGVVGAVWAARPSIWVSACAVGSFTAVYGPLALLWISMDVDGFSPS